VPSIEVVWRGRQFDLVAWCTAFPTGLGIAVGAIAGAVAIKDRNVAAARQAGTAAAAHRSGENSGKA